jgi:uridine phosphorylase
MLAQVLLERPRMFNHNRGLWGYTGTASDGQELTIQSTGMGGPSTAIVISELAELGARQLLRVGTCGAIDATLALGDLLIATEAISADGTSRALGAGERLAASPALLSALRTAAASEARGGPIASIDLFYGEGELRFADQGAMAVEMETATLFALGQLREELEVASILIVTDTLIPKRKRIPTQDLRAAEHRLGELALAALSSPSLAPAEPHNMIGN